jgi:hypothetical protein
MSHRCEIYSGPDSAGRYHYALFWMADYHPGHPDGEYRTAERGQHFFGKPPNDVPQVDKRKATK